MTSTFVLNLSVAAAFPADLRRSKPRFQQYCNHINLYKAHYLSVWVLTRVLALETGVCSSNRDNITNPRWTVLGSNDGQAHKINRIKTSASRMFIAFCFLILYAGAHGQVCHCPIFNTSNILCSLYLTLRLLYISSIDNNLCRAVCS